MSYDSNNDEYVIHASDTTYGHVTNSSLAVVGYEPNNLVPFVVYEGNFDDGGINNDLNSPSDCTFSGLSLLNNGNPVPVNWSNNYDQQFYSPHIDKSAPLSGLAVIGAYQGSTSITLRTTYSPSLSVSTSSTSHIEDDLAKLNGNLTGMGSAGSIDVSFDWGTTTAYGSNIVLTQSQSTTGLFGVTLTGLSRNTTYHYRAKAVGNGTVWGNDQQFTTLPFIGFNDAVDNSSYAFTSSGTDYSDWFGETAVSHSGGDAAQSGYILDGQSSWIQTTVNSPGTVSFWWKVNSEQNYDWLSFYIDSVLQDRISGSLDTSTNLPVTGSGTHTLKWEYTKNASTSDGSDCGWIDAFTFTATTYTLSASASNGGTVTTPGTGSFGPYNYGQGVNLVASPSTGYHFVNWTGDTGTIANVNSASTTITMNGNYSIQANFAADAPSGPVIIISIGTSSSPLGPVVIIGINTSP
jgi:hypothetical protein